ncbi:hypothetical protein [Megavirus chiliensis]|uniref:Uncharacterized protein n=1 Tax=Megavirus chiliensis TaxID=1094892 RepID=G5CQB7_9VIRU|nr:hypothetical protein MegaChil _gp0006 [Megavirus chiliensis]AEQ32559.1 hypothetical protein [Megavirus chiliensis]
MSKTLKNNANSKTTKTKKTTKMNKTTKMSKTKSNEIKLTETNIEPINKNKAMLSAKIESLIENGRKEIKRQKELEKYPIGSLISYFNKDGVFKIGGFIKNFGDDNFVYLSSDFEKNIRVRYCNVDKMYVGDVFKTKNDIVSIVPYTKTKTNFPVKIGDVVVYYGKNNTMSRRFMHTQKYKRMDQWYKIFSEMLDGSE